MTYIKNWRSVSLENCKNSELVPKCSCKNHRALRHETTGWHEDRPRKGRPGVASAAEEKFIWVTSLRNHKLTAPQIRAQMSSSSRHISTSAVQRRLCESGLYGQTAAKKTLLRKSKKQKRFIWAKKHKQWTLDQWTSVPWSDGLILRCLVPPTVSLCDAEKVNDGLYMVPTVKPGGGGVMVWGCFAGDTVEDLFKTEDTLNQHGYHSILQPHAISSGLQLVGPSFIFQQDNDNCQLDNAEWR